MTIVIQSNKLAPIGLTRKACEKGEQVTTFKYVKGFCKGTGNNLLSMSTERDNK